MIRVSAGAIAAVLAVTLSAYTTTSNAGDSSMVANVEKGGKLPSFETTSQSCQNHALFDSQWANRGKNYGADQVSGDDGFVSGFYQIAGDEQNIYVSFGGALTDERQPVKGVLPGSLVVLDGDSLALKRLIPLPFHGYALSYQPEHQRAIVSHSRAGTISVVDLKTDAVQCLQPNASVGEEKFRNRYVTSDKDGNFYVSYYFSAKEGGKSTIAKFDKTGRPAVGYTPNLTENNMVLAAFYHQGEVLTGSKGLKAVDSATGQVRTILDENDAWSVYNFTKGPRGTVLAIQHEFDGVNNVWMIDPKTKRSSTILTGLGSLEAAYIEESEQLFVTNYGSKTLSIVALSKDGSGFEKNQFVNIPFDGSLVGLYARRTAKGTEVFVTPKWNDQDIVTKITIAPSVKGIQGLNQPGACTMKTFDLKDESVSQSEPCGLLDAKASLIALQKQVQENKKD